jgi:hypothetical protein
MVHVLVHHGADLEAEGKHGKTPIHMAQNAAVAMALHSHGANVHKKNSRGYPGKYIFK